MAFSFFQDPAALPVMSMSCCRGSFLQTQKLFRLVPTIPSTPHSMRMFHTPIISIPKQAPFSPLSSLSKGKPVLQQSLYIHFPDLYFPRRMTHTDCMQCNRMGTELRNQHGQIWKCIHCRWGILFFILQFRTSAPATLEMLLPGEWLFIRFRIALPETWDKETPTDVK